MPKIADIKTAISHIFKTASREGRNEPSRSKRLRSRPVNNLIDIMNADVKSETDWCADRARNFSGPEQRDTNSPGNRRPDSPLGDDLNQLAEHLVDLDTLSETRWTIIDDIIGRRLDDTTNEEPLGERAEALLMEAAQTAVRLFSRHQLQKLHGKVLELMGDAAAAPTDDFRPRPGRDGVIRRLLVLQCLSKACESRLGNDASATSGGDESPAVVTVRALAKSPKKTADRIALRHGALEWADELHSLATKRACSPADRVQLIRQGLADCVEGYNSRQLKTIIRNAVHANFTAGCHKVGNDDEAKQKTIAARELVMKLVVEACLDRLSQKRKVSPLSEHRKISDAAVLYAYQKWVLEPGNRLAHATRCGLPPDALHEAIEELVVGYKAFGRGRLARALFDDFNGTLFDGLKGKAAWPGDETIAEIGRRAIALDKRATAKDRNITPRIATDLYATSRVMRQVYWTYHLAKEATRAESLSPKQALRTAIKKLKASPTPKPTASHKNWAATYLRSNDPASPEALQLKSDPVPLPYVQQMAQRLFEGLANGDTEGSALALKALVTLGWSDHFVELFKAVLRESGTEALIGIEKQVIRLWGAALSFANREKTKLGAAAEEAAWSLVSAYHEHIGGDPTTRYSVAGDSDAPPLYSAVFKDDSRGTFAQIHHHLSQRDIYRRDEDELPRLNRVGGPDEPADDQGDPLAALFADMGGDLDQGLPPDPVHLNRVGGPDEPVDHQEDPLAALFADMGGDLDQALAPDPDDPLHLNRVGGPDEPVDHQEDPLAALFADMGGDLDQGLAPDPDDPVHLNRVGGPDEPVDHQQDPLAALFADMGGDLDQALAPDPDDPLQLNRDHGDDRNRLIQDLDGMVEELDELERELATERVAENRNRLIHDIDEMDGELIELEREFAANAERTPENRNGLIHDLDEMDRELDALEREFAANAERTPENRNGLIHDIDEMDGELEELAGEFGLGGEDLARAVEAAGATSPPAWVSAQPTRNKPQVPSAKKIDPNRAPPSWMNGGNRLARRNLDGVGPNPIGNSTRDVGARLASPESRGAGTDDDEQTIDTLIARLDTELPVSSQQANTDGEESEAGHWTPPPDEWAHSPGYRRTARDDKIEQRAQRPDFTIEHLTRSLERSNTARTIAKGVRKVEDLRDRLLGAGANARRKSANQVTPIGPLLTGIRYQNVQSFLRALDDLRKLGRDHYVTIVRNAVGSRRVKLTQRQIDWVQSLVERLGSRTLGEDLDPRVKAEIDKTLGLWLELSREIKGLNPSGREVKIESEKASQAMTFLKTLYQGTSA
jgi:hypothetical protein